MPSLSTHVLDTSRGKPAAGVAVTLREAGGRELSTAITDFDGRITRDRLSAESLPAGVYELIFRTGDYFRRAGSELAEPPFVDDIVIRFGIAEDAHYHVPLLVSPFGYSTYRGS